MKFTALLNFQHLHWWGRQMRRDTETNDCI